MGNGKSAEPCLRPRVRVPTYLTTGSESYGLAEPPSGLHPDVDPRGECEPDESADKDEGDDGVGDVVVCLNP